MTGRVLSFARSLYRRLAPLFIAGACPCYIVTPRGLEHPLGPGCPCTCHYPARIRLVPSEYGGLLPRTPRLAEYGPELHHPRPVRRRDPQRALIAALYRQADMPVRLALIAAGWPPDGAPGAA